MSKYFLSSAVSQVILVSLLHMDTKKIKSEISQGAASKTTDSKDPMQEAADSAKREHWTLRPPEDVRRLVERAIKECGRDKTFWISECIRLGLRKYAGKKDGQPVVLKG